MFGKEHNATSILIQASDYVDLLVLIALLHIIAFYKICQAIGMNRTWNRCDPKGFV